MLLLYSDKICNYMESRNRMQVEKEEGWEEYWKWASAKGT